MLESSLSNKNEINPQRNLITNFSNNSFDNAIRLEIDKNQPDFVHHRQNNLDPTNSKEFQNFVKQMILNLVAKTETELNMISTMTQEYKKAASSKIH